jgi:hypothetical protein
MKTLKLLLAALATVALPLAASSVVPPPDPNPNLLLDYWTFNDTVTWADGYGDAPLSFTNIVASEGRGPALLIDSTNAAWLQFNVVEAQGYTNIAVDYGSLSLWFCPSWSSTNEGGAGPGCWGRLIEVGAATDQLTNGWWSLYFDPDGANLYFAGQTNGSPATVWLSAPIAWHSYEWHAIDLNYGLTNTQLFLDGVLVTNGLPMTAWPGPDVLTNGFWIGSDSNGVAQAHGAIDDLYAYNFQYDTNSIRLSYLTLRMLYYGGPPPDPNINPAPYTPPPTPTLNAITGSGYLTTISNYPNCIASSDIWFTNLSAKPLPTGTANLTFSIAGGQDYVLYDLFANALLAPTNDPAYQWAWMGQGYHCQVYTATNLPPAMAFLRLGSPQDSDADGLTDAFEMLVTHTDPTKPDTSLDGISDLYKLFHKLPLTGTVAVPSLNSITIQSCPVP